MSKIVEDIRSKLGLDVATSKEDVERLLDEIDKLQGVVASLVETISVHSDALDELYELSDQLVDMINKAGADTHLKVTSEKVSKPN